MAAAWLVHLVTASGVVLAFLAARAVFEHDYRQAFFWLFVQGAVDSIDGSLARWAAVSTRIPWFDGARLDDIVDYLAYVFVPALFVWRSLLVPDSWALAVVSAMLLSSAYAFGRSDAKTVDHFYTGFPSYWNVAVFYLFIAGLPSRMNDVILLALALLVFVPIRYVYPSRTQTLRPVTLALGVGWALLLLLMLRDYPLVSRPVLLASLVFPLYYTVLSVALEARRRLA